MYVSFAVFITLQNLPFVFQPLKYAYESIMTNEFRTLDFECSNLVPQGPGYENIALENQVCTVVGAVPGQPTVNGLQYLKLSFNYKWTHMWRVRNRFIVYQTLITSFLHPHLQNFGITVAFGITFLAAYLIITEFKSKLAETRSVVTFKHGTTKTKTSAPQSGDIETAAPTAANSADDLRGNDAKAEKALATAEKMTDTFSWEGLNYTVLVSGGAEKGC